MKWAWKDRNLSVNIAWTVSGLYLRRSMLVALARQILDFDVPSLFYLHTTFENIDYGVRKSQKEEEAFVASLAAKIINEWMEVKPWVPKVGGLRVNSSDSDDSDDMVD
jgi:hypothetical protein